MAPKNVLITAPTAAAATAAAVATAMGLCFLGRNHVTNLANYTETGRKFRGLMSSFAAQAEEDTKANSAAAPKLAPQFDGLFWFETIVGH